MEKRSSSRAIWSWGLERHPQRRKLVPRECVLHDDGLSVQFWLDIWCGNESLSSAFPGIFLLATSKQGLICEQKVSEALGLASDLQLRRLLNWKMDEIISLLHWPDDATIGSVEVEDMRVWPRNLEGIYSVKSGYQILN